MPGAFYCSPEIYELEKRHIFMKDWLCVARVEELESPGDYMAVRIMGEPALIVRDDEGELRAFSNTCAHRGVEVIWGEGNTGHFSCPYHGWSYDLKGALTGAAFMEDSEEFDPSRCGLPPLRLGTWAGWVFITFDDDAPPLADFVAHFEREFGFLRQEDCRLAVKIEVELDCNWKLFVENLLDVYHAATLHAKTIGAKRGRADRYPFNLFERGGTSMFYHSAPMVPRGESLFGKMPWLDDKPDNFACSGRLSPNMQLIARCDNVHPFLMWPLGPDRCGVVNYTLFPKEHFDLPGFEERIEVYREYLIEVVEEDRQMVASLQQNMKSRRLRPGPMSKLELGIHHVINDVLDRVCRDDDPG
ncbi:MAG: aromatic ring-hydroxylating dioxygenase subunit alpha [Defluviicoccus sp.]|nr:aromatic ring-hydroxylating dioxygenase subunit alpha [Defluviicoccus sp.]MDE0275202.1 aromatic ring-hydroxylating dioxygenase subunit alpha [Defluviicoccus sp.]